MRLRMLLLNLNDKNLKISGENEKTIYNSIEEQIIRDYEIYEFINKKD